MRARGIIALLLVGFIFGAGTIGGISVALVARERSASADALAEARRIGDEARSANDRLGERLGDAIGILDGQLAAAAGASGYVDRQSKRDAAYKGLADEIRNIAREMD